MQILQLAEGHLFSGCRLSRLARFKFRLDLSFMAAPATNRTLSPVKFLDNSMYHAEHFACFLFAVFIVFIPLIWYVAVPTPDAQTICQEDHDHRQYTRRRAYLCMYIQEQLLSRFVLVLGRDVVYFVGLLRHVLWINHLPGLGMMTPTSAYLAFFGEVVF